MGRERPKEKGELQFGSAPTKIKERGRWAILYYLVGMIGLLIKRYELLTKDDIEGERVRQDE